MAVEDTEYLTPSGVPSNEESTDDPDYENASILEVLSKHLKSRITFHLTIRSIGSAPAELDVQQKEKWVLLQHEISLGVTNELTAVKSVIDDKIKQLKDMGGV